jgi:MEDS: MEthanogen/methylotroph, DcmR Sensory domain
VTTSAPSTPERQNSPKSPRIVVQGLKAGALLVCCERQRRRCRDSRAAKAPRQRGRRKATECTRVLEGIAAYIVHGEFNPEKTVETFSDAIEAALKDGFTGFRAVANMTWALRLKNGAQRVIAYEALLRPLFATSPATGLCLYDRQRMPLDVLNGALVTHPIAGVNGRFRTNPYYLSEARELPAGGADVPAKLSALARPACRRTR